MRVYECTEERFQLDIATHRMEVQLNAALHRHLRFSRTGSSSYHFNITTWPGYLCISGDMGCYVFSRQPDMFDFFRGGRINPQYWSEKVQSKSAFGNGTTEFDAELFMAGFKERVGDYIEDLDITEEQKAAIIALAVNEFRHTEENQHFYCDKAYNFDFADLDLPEELEAIKLPKWQVDEFWSMEKYTFHYIWCCRAIVWAIDKFDAEIKSAIAEEAIA